MLKRRYEAAIHPQVRATYERTLHTHTYTHAHARALPADEEQPFCAWTDLTCDRHPLEFLHFDLRLHSTRTYIRLMLVEYAHAARSLTMLRSLSRTAGDAERDSQ